MSEINTNGLSVNYPVAGVNNTTQGFRDNFASIKNNLDVAGNEITDLQSKVILKAALNATTINNDMANTLISNASTRSFRASTYNLGNNIQGTTIINVSQGDVQYGAITANTVLQFGGWAPVNTQSNVQLSLTIANANAFISFPDTQNDGSNIPSTGMGASARLLENYFSNTSPAPSISYTNIISIPAGVTILNLTISTLNCGTLLEVFPNNRNQQASQVVPGTPIISNVTATGTLTCSSSSNSVTGSGTLFTTELVAGRTILSTSNVVIGIVSSISSNTALTLRANAAITQTAGYNRQLPIGQQGDVAGAIRTDGTNVYICTANYAGGNTTIWKSFTINSY
jgi:hypothetical protein